MPIPTPFHERTSQLCTSLLYKEWAGYYAVRSYDTYADREYFAIRHAAGMIDVTPLFKYEVRGKDAAEYLSRIMVRNIRKLKPGQVFYTCWCDGDGKVVDDGTVSYLAENHYRVTSAEPGFAWLSRFVRGFDVTVEDVSERIGALSIQGPHSRDVLNNVLSDDITGVKYFWSTHSRIANVPVVVTRTGYTGDLGYELWVAAEHAVSAYDAILAGGHEYGLLPVGLDAMDMTRIEAGYILNGVDYYSSIHCMIESRKSTPYELGLGWMVRLKRPPFNGSEALREEKRRGATRHLVCLETDWDEYEAHFAVHKLPPELDTAAWRVPIPVYDGSGRQVGYANSGSWSPTLKKNLALATVEHKCHEVGTKLQFEVTVEYERKTVTATVIDKPAFDPERKRS